MQADHRTYLGVAIVLCIATLGLTGCYGQLPYENSVTRANQEACGADGCHAKDVTAQAASMHSAVGCDACHQGTGAKHAADPKKAVATTDWTIASCAGCHRGEATTYLYDDNKRVGPFGGSVRVPPQPKVATFPEYNVIVSGHAFAKDYNEEGAHKFMLEDHYSTKRGKFETCMQCKSTKVALAFRDGKTLKVAKDTPVTLTHTASGTVPPKAVVIPSGTTITYRTDPKTRFVDAKATFPDGSVWTSQPDPSVDTTKNYNMVWASTVAATKETWPYGAGCNHCHDPHTAELRLVRQALVQSIEGAGGPSGSGGVNPYVKDSPKDPAKASAQDRRILSCAQCHVEYTCGKSGVDKKDRDAYGWSKAKDLHELYLKQFDYKQDWIQKIIGQPLIKNQHPETELFWQSVHYDAGASCGDCHMPEVKLGNEVFRSHWFTSPYKYENAATFAGFVQAVGLDASYKDKPCARCHEDRMQRGIEQQQTFFSAQKVVEKRLATSVERLGAVPAAKRTGATYDAALTAHRKAHVLWENVAVSENSMGFHNFEEAMASMAEARVQIDAALAAEADLLR